MKQTKYILQFFGRKNFEMMIFPIKVQLEFYRITSSLPDQKDV